LSKGGPILSNRPMLFHKTSAPYCRPRRLATYLATTVATGQGEAHRSYHINNTRLHDLFVVRRWIVTALEYKSFINTSTTKRFGGIIRLIFSIALPSSKIANLALRSAWVKVAAPKLGGSRLRPHCGSAGAVFVRQKLVRKRRALATVANKQHHQNT
jgi:hypothetical protein